MCLENSENFDLQEDTKLGYEAQISLYFLEVLTEVFKESVS